MPKFLIALLTVFCFTSFAQKDNSSGLLKHNMSQKVLLEKMEKAVDPDGVCKKWKTIIIKMEMSVPMQKVKVSASVMAKFPDKTKTVAIIPGMPKVIEVLNGNKAWKETVGLGLQMKTGVQLAFAKFKARKTNPTLTLPQIYEKVTLDPYLYKFGKYQCYKLICSAPKDLNVKAEEFFVDDKEFLPRGHIASEYTEMGVIPVTSEFMSYKKLKGTNMPTHINSYMMGIKLTGKILSIEPNAKIADSEFKFPNNK
jgi:hypothetical protein